MKKTFRAVDSIIKARDDRTKVSPGIIIFARTFSFFAIY